eukprot:TRINITY_DN1688_c1_g3_i6.p1 TRINITY_DN1688_c1_g3~~TRINITY_DN1688_c1_g3_i6.p1  ORF type:complete len:550 (-),score=144.05 TRINITY_DN1688_c1_g3_i6:43-1692(-)
MLELTIPSTTARIIGGKKRHTFALRLRNELAHYEVTSTKLYQDFVDLHARLCQEGVSNVPPCPPKEIFGKLDGEGLENGRQRLEEYARELLSCPQVAQTDTFRFWLDFELKAFEPLFLETAVALYDYTPKETGMLPLRTGNQIIVRDRTNPDWWVGESNGQSGQFPGNYVQLNEVPWTNVETPLEYVWTDVMKTQKELDSLITKLKKEIGGYAGITRMGFDTPDAKKQLAECSAAIFDLTIKRDIATKKLEVERRRLAAYPPPATQSPQKSESEKEKEKEKEKAKEAEKPKEKEKEKETEEEEPVEYVTRQRAEALYEYVGQNSGDLSFSLGALMLLLSPPADGWVVAEINGVSGNVPLSYIRLLDMVEVPVSTPDRRSSTGTHQVVAAAIKYHAITLYPYSALNDGELSFGEGERIIVERAPNERNAEWLHAEIGGQIGLVPANYVQIDENSGVAVRSEKKMLKKALKIGAKTLHKIRSMPPPSIPDAFRLKKKEKFTPAEMEEALQQMREQLYPLQEELAMMRAENQELTEQIAALKKENEELKARR